VAKNTLTVTLAFDMTKPESFAQFCKALSDGGFRDGVRQMAKRLKVEAAKRGISLDDAVNADGGEVHP
jgi:hypothetical protein